MAVRPSCFRKHLPHHPAVHVGVGVRVGVSLLNACDSYWMCFPYKLLAASLRSDRYTMRGLVLAFPSNMYSCLWEDTTGTLCAENKLSECVIWDIARYLLSR